MDGWGWGGWSEADLTTDVRPRLRDIGVSNDLTVRPILLGEWIPKLIRSSRSGEVLNLHCQCGLPSNHSGD